MEDELKEVECEMKRTCRWKLKKKMTKEDYEDFKKNYDGNIQELGIDVLDEFGADPTDPDSWDDETETWSDWDEELEG